MSRVRVCGKADADYLASTYDYGLRGIPGLKSAVAGIVLLVFSN